MCSVKALFDFAFFVWIQLLNIRGSELADFPLRKTLEKMQITFRQTYIFQFLGVEEPLSLNDNLKIYMNLF